MINITKNYQALKIFCRVVMSIISLGFNFYEIILFSGDWEYGWWVDKRKKESGKFSSDDYYDETTINNVVGLIFILGIF